ncbi:uncharacterized protein A4U43_C03F10810 [Asparagus officinalis]|uniref:Uncharacterized protein n=1 Tax=Asparagus officinalis TaxID=4686 RepID=A0A5P1F9S8_ASPOF|nr:uncharacterized protein A4U43_C03F10810 [Asparagus officinalis]
MHLAPRSEGPSSRGPQALASGGALHNHPLPHSQRPRLQQHRHRARCRSTQPLDRRRWVDDTGVRPGQDLEKKMSVPVWETKCHHRRQKRTYATRASSFGGRFCLWHLEPSGEHVSSPQKRKRKRKRCPVTAGSFAG